MKISYYSILFCLLVLVCRISPLQAQNLSISGKVLGEKGEPLKGAQVFITKISKAYTTNSEGVFRIASVKSGTYTLTVFHFGMESIKETVKLSTESLKINFELTPLSQILEELTVEEAKEETFGIKRLKSVEGTAIYEGKKSEVIVISDITANLATNNSRQVYGKIAGLNIWESDGAGVQLGIGARGLSPNRSSNFNTRQNGYDIAADALGYPESYYTPPVRALETIEIVRGAASLQYGTQFGGLLNFVFKEGPKQKPIELETHQTLGSFGLFNSFTSLGGTKGKVSYYSFYQYKTSNGWRPNSSLDQHMAFASVKYQVSDKFSIRPEYTFMHYVAQQPGGLTDRQFVQDARQSNRERNWFRVDWNLMALNLDYEVSSRLKINSRFFGLIAGRDALGNLGRIDRLDDGGNRDFISDDFTNWGNETRAIYNYNLAGNTSVFLVGGRFYKGFTERMQGDGNNGSEADFYFLNPDNLEGSAFDLPSQNIALFAENIFSLSDKFSITPGVRFEHIKTETSGYYKETVRDLAGNILIDERIEEQKTNVRSFLFFGLGGSYKPNERLEVYTNFSQNYRAINFNDIRVDIGSLVVDPNISDERGYNIDLGIRGNIDHVLNFDVSVFHLSYDDRIGTVLKSEPNPQFNNLVDRIIRFRSNIADAKIYGFESFAEVDILKLLDKNSLSRLSVFSNLALITAKYTESPEIGIEGNKVELVPEINIKTGATFTKGNFDFTYQLTFVSEQFSDASNAPSTPTAIEGIIPSFSVMDLSMSYKRGRYSFEAGANNMTDNIYFTRRATGYPGPGIIPSDGRSFYFTVGLKI